MMIPSPWGRSRSRIAWARGSPIHMIPSIVTEAPGAPPRPCRSSTPKVSGIVVDVLVGTFLGDTGAYLGGRAFGTTKLAPRISPNKTVEGLVVGMVVAVAGVWFTGLYQDWLSGTDALLLGLAVAVLAPIGDLFESYLKRDAGTKDTGTLFGAHGGALDRLDAVLFTVVAGYYVWVGML